jgi:hypothetical protein
LKALFITCSLVLIGLTSCVKEKAKDNNDNNSNTEEQNNIEPDLGTISYDYKFRSLLLEFTSTGCPGCGSWGKPTFYNLAKNNADNVIPIAAHIKYGDPMISGVAEFLASNRVGSRYTPQIWVNDKSIMVIENNRINGTQSIQNANDLIKNASKNEGYGLGSRLIIQDGKAYTKYGISMKAEVPAGDYYVSSYLMEDGILADQAGVSSSSNPVTHNFVVRQAANATWGNKVTKIAGEPLLAEWEHTYNDNVKEGQYLVNIVWKKEGNIYKPVNISKS